MRNRSAVSIVEVIVALSVFSIGALGSAAVLTHAVHARTLAHARRDAVHALRKRAMTLSTIPCASLTNGTAVIDGVTVSWSATIAQSVARVALRAEHRNTATTLAAEFSCA